MVVERKREEFVDRTGDTTGIENGSWTILKLWKIGITTYTSKFQGIQALELLSLPWLGSPPVAWDEAVIWALVILPSIMPSGRSQDNSTNGREEIL